MHRSTVFMGDVVESTKQPSARLKDDFQTIVDGINSTFKEKIDSPLTVTLGDEFQGLINSVNIACHAVLFALEMKISNQLPFDIRYVINKGRIDTEINKKIAYGMMGPALVFARKKLTEKGRSRPWVQVFIDEKPVKELNDLFFLVREIFDKWKPKDYPLIKSMIDSGDDTAIANQFGKDRSQIWKRRNTLMIESYRKLKGVIDARSVDI